MISLNLFIASDTNVALHVSSNISFMWPQTSKRHFIFHSFLDEPHLPLLFPDSPSVAKREKEKKKKNLSYTASEAVVTRQPSIYFKITCSSSAKGKRLFKTVKLRIFKAHLNQS